ncbi:MAG: type II CAAX prenyl endopeptidase Rce1 family protein [Sphingomonadaceae bacterium]
MGQASAPGAPPRTASLAVLLAGQAGMAALAFILAPATGISPLALFAFDVAGLLAGLAGALVLVLASVAMRIVAPETARRADRDMLALFAELGLALRWRVVVLLGAAAGICEELLFRGALQGWLMTLMPLAAAAALASLPFALLHPLSRFYVAATFVISLFLGFLYALAANLLAPILAHMLYDFYALARLKALARRPRPDS